MTSIPKSVYIDKLDGMVNKYNNMYLSTIKMKPAIVKGNTYIDFSKGSNNNKNPKFKIGDYVIISKYKNFFLREYTRNWSEEVVMTKKVENTVPCTYIISDVNSEKIVGTFYEKICKKQSKKNLEQKK